jgi:hypothetical protein
MRSTRISRPECLTQGKFVLRVNHTSERKIPDFSIEVFYNCDKAITFDAVKEQAENPSKE